MAGVRPDSFRFRWKFQPRGDRKLPQGSMSTTLLIGVCRTPRLMHTGEWCGEVTQKLWGPAWWDAITTCVSCSLMVDDVTHEFQNDQTLLVSVSADLPCSICPISQYFIPTNLMQLCAGKYSHPLISSMSVWKWQCGSDSLGKSPVVMLADLTSGKPPAIGELGHDLEHNL